VTRRFRTIVLAAAVLPLVVLIGLRSAWAAYACSVDGEVRAACCCPQKSDEQRPGDGAPRVEASCCCEITVGESSVPPDARLAEPSRIHELSWVAVAVVMPGLAARATPPALGIAYARPPPPKSALPTYLANRTILR
jgi:hypothetical protein